MDDSLVLDGSLGRRKVRVIKDDECNTNVVPQAFFEKNYKYLNWKKCKVEESHSQKGSV